MHGIKDVKVPRGLVLIFQADAKYHFYPFQFTDPLFYESTSHCFRHPTGAPGCTSALWVNEVLMAEPGFGSPTPNTARKGSKPQNSQSTTGRKWWLRERKTWRWVDEENGTKGKILQQGNQSVYLYLPKGKRLKGSCWGDLELSWRLHYPVMGREQTSTQDREIPWHILSSHIFLR